MPRPFSLHHHPHLQQISADNRIFLSLQLLHVPIRTQIPATQPRPPLLDQPDQEGAAKAYVIHGHRVRLRRLPDRPRQRAHDARMDRVGEHAVGGVGLCDRLGQPVGGEGGDVVAEGAHAGEVGQGARDVDDGAGAAGGLAQQRQQGLDGGSLADVVDRRGLRELVELDGVERVEGRGVRADDGGVVDEEVEAAVGGDGVGKKLGGGWIRDVGR